VADVVRALLLLLDHPGAIGKVFNVGSNQEISIAALARRVVASAKSRSTIRLIPYEQAYETGFEDMARRVPDTTKLRELTGWQPTRTLADVLRETIGEATLEQVTMERMAAKRASGRASLSDAL
jgi:UDP-glucose 4-epimerase